MARHPLSMAAPGPPLGEKVRALLLLLLAATPLAALVAKGIPRCLDPLLFHLASTVLPARLGVSLGAAVSAVLLGALLASGGVLSGLFEFPGRPLLQRLSLLPLLVPSWFVAVLYQRTLDLSGVLALALVLGIGAAPLYQLLLTASLRTVPAPFYESLRQLGHGSPLALARHLLPLAVPALAAASAVTFLLAWADAAGARTLAVPTLTVGLYDQWFGRQDDAAGAPIALALLLVTLLPVLCLWAWVVRGRFRSGARLQRRSMERHRLRGPAAAVPWLLGAPQIALGVLYPGLVIGRWTLDRVHRVDLATLGRDLGESLLLAAGATLLAAVLALSALRQQVAGHAPRLVGGTTGVLLATFAVPPLVLALAFLWLVPEPGGSALAVWLNATPIPLALALGLRFAAVFLVLGQASLLRVPRAHTDALRVSGRTDGLSFLRLFRPFLSGGVTAAACLVFLACLQDSSLTLVLQPFGLDTVSSRLLQYVETQRVPECAVWVLCQALVGSYPLMLLSRLADASEGHDAR